MTRPRDNPRGRVDPEVVRHFFACRTELYAIHQRGLGESVVRAVEQAVVAASNGDNGPPSFLPAAADHR